MHRPEPSPASFTRYLRRLALSLTSAIILVLLLVISIDPYGLYGMPRIAGFNALKPYPQQHQNEIKLTRAHQARAELIIAGNSRAEIGFDPLNAARLKPDGQRERAMSLAVPGQGIGGTRAQLEYLERQQALPRRLILGLEFLDFLQASPAQPHTSPASLPAAPTTSRHPVERLAWRLDTLFSLSALRDALRTPFIQQAADPAILTAEGHNPLLDYRPLARQEGYARLFRQRAEENARHYARLAPGHSNAAAWADYSAILELAARHSIELELVIYPYHAQILAMFESAGLWPAFDTWKERATAEISSLRSSYPDAHITLYDFSGYGPSACEHIPPLGDLKTETRWYWEAGHFKNALGDLVLQRLHSVDTLTNHPDTFGMRLDEQTQALVNNRQRIATERKACQQDHPQLFTEAGQLMAHTR